MYYKSIGDRTLVQLDEHQLHWKFNEESNSIAILIQHLGGNMLSRFTDFLTSDGEKSNRNRDAEFEEDNRISYDQLMDIWEKGWSCTFQAVDKLTSNDLEKIITIRGEDHTVFEALNRQLAHYSYHVGQMVTLGKMQADNNWMSLTIPKGKSQEYNDSKKQ